MNDPSANTILKTLEEPAGNTMLILTAVSREALLPTIVSRCQCVRFDPLTEDEIKDALIGREGVDGQRAALVARLANGSYLRAMELLADDLNQVRGHVLEFIRRSVAGNVAALNEQIEGLAAGKNRMEVYNFLALLLMWFRDALVLLHGGEVINLDQKESLERFVQRYPSADLGALIGETERAVFLLERNVYIKLVLIHLAFKIKKHVLTPSAASVTSVES
jgi:DNA polymerase-3 subunit delta'